MYELAEEHETTGRPRCRAEIQSFLSVCNEVKRSPGGIGRTGKSYADAIKEILVIAERKPFR